MWKNPTVLCSYDRMSDGASSKEPLRSCIVAYLATDVEVEDVFDDIEVKNVGACDVHVVVVGVRAVEHHHIFVGMSP